MHQNGVDAPLLKPANDPSGFPPFAQRKSREGLLIGRFAAPEFNVADRCGRLKPSPALVRIAVSRQAPQFNLREFLNEPFVQLNTVWRQRIRDDGDASLDLFALNLAFRRRICAKLSAMLRRRLDGFLLQPGSFLKAILF